MYRPVQTLQELEEMILDDETVYVWNETVYVWNTSDPDGNHFFIPVVVNHMSFQHVLNCIYAATFYKKIN